MSIELLRAALGWGFVINYGVLLLWFAFFVFAHDLMHRLYGKWFQLSVETFDATHYKAMAYYKLSIFLFYLTPYIALHIVG